eukprot:TRINITY_DN9959_c0_g1_i1.p1 TRINITY_DN9959_c0_g1~~TRINITY_DN9959_c0_g1_i1.p1  ORF type:complete len:664 (-),score=100.89 TRINITY_DN9959_c0_g1_i1:135-2126(-)
MGTTVDGNQFMPLEKGLATESTDSLFESSVFDLNKANVVPEAFKTFLDDAFRRQTEFLLTSMSETIAKEFSNQRAFPGMDVSKSAFSPAILLSDPSYTNGYDRAPSKNSGSFGVKSNSEHSAGIDNSGDARKKGAAKPLSLANVRPSVYLRKDKTFLTQLRKLWAMFESASDIPTTKRQKLQFIVCSLPFDVTIATVLCAYAISLSFQAEELLKEGEINSPWTLVLDVFFAAIFLGEIILKIVAFGLKFFVGPDSVWNNCTLLLVIMQICELILDFTVARSLPGGDANLVGFRLVRMLRLTRVIRAARLFSLVQELRTIVISVLGSLRHVCWTLILMMLVAWVCALSIVMMVGAGYERCDGHIRTGNCSEYIYKYFGSLGAAMFSLFAAVSGGLDWQLAALTLLEEVDVTACLVMVAYVVFVVFALVNSVTGVFVDSALRSSEQAQAELLSSMAHSVFSQTLSQGACDGEDAFITREAFLEAMQGETMRVYFANLDVNIEDPHKIFDLIDVDRSGTIEVSEFVESIHRMKGQAKALDFLSFVHMWQVANDCTTRRMEDIEMGLGRIATLAAHGIFQTPSSKCEFDPKPQEALLKESISQMRELTQLVAQHTPRLGSSADKAGNHVVPVINSRGICLGRAEGVPSFSEKPVAMPETEPPISYHR